MYLRPVLFVGGESLLVPGNWVLLWRLALLWYGREELLRCVSLLRERLLIICVGLLDHIIQSLIGVLLDGHRVF